MQQNETHAILRLLYAVALVDGDINQEEERVMTVAREALRDDLNVIDKVDIEAEAKQLKTQETKVATFEAAVALATVDGRCSPEEHALLERLRVALGLDLPLPVVDRETRWTERMAETRAAMRSAERDFLHELSAKKDALSQDEYRALVDSLHRAQVSALHETMDSALEGRASYVVMPPD